MDKIKTVKIKNPDGSVSEESYTISVDAKNVDMDNGKELQETIGTIDIDTDGNIAEQLENLNDNVDDLNIDIKKKAYFFDTVADMKNANLKVGDYACTLGYYTANDGGGAEYKILSSSINYYEKLNNNLKAELIIKNNINIKQFGAYGDNIHNDTVAIQAAIDYANTHIQKTIFIPNGVYLCNIIVYPKIEIVGEVNSVLKSVSGSNTDVIKSYDFDEMTGTTTIIPDNKGLYYFKLENIIIDGNLNNNTSGYGIKIFGRNLKFINVNVKNCASGGIYTEFGTHNAPTYGDDSFYSDLLESVFERIKVFNCLGNGWTYKGPHDSHIKYYICVKCQGWALNADNTTSNGLIIENLNSWWCNNGVIASNCRLSNCQIDGGSYDGSGSAVDSIGLQLRNDCGNVFINNCSIGTWGFGAILGGTGHMINGLYVRQAFNTNIYITNMTQSTLNFRIMTNRTGTNLFKIDGSGANLVNGFIAASDGNTLFSGTHPYGQGHNNYNITSSSEDYVYYQMSAKEINVKGWKPVLPLSNGTLIPDNKKPTATSRGGVLQQTISNFPSGETATTNQINSLIAALRTAGVFNQNQ